MLIETFVAAVCLGIVAQVVAERFRLPAILPLLVAGVVGGPAVLGIVQPAGFGHGLEVIVHLGVAVILFEGGLSLDLAQLSRVGGAVRNLLTVGVLVSGAGAAVVAHYLAGLSWPVAALFGAILTVTGPTVIAPLMRHMIAPRSVKTILLSEGLIIDPIGAVLAYLVLQAIEHAERGPAALGLQLLEVGFVGGVLGFAAGAVGRTLAGLRWLSNELRNLAILALLMVLYVVADHYAAQSGILAAVVMGLTLSGSRVPDLVAMKTFKEQLTTFLISLLFVLLSAQLDLDSVWALGWRGPAVAIALIVVVRPLSVLASVLPRHLPWRQRLTLALIAPRGIVAAAVASLSAISLGQAGIGGGTALEGLVYVSIMVTCLLATVASIALPRLLGFIDDPSRRRTVLVGSNPLSVLLARRLAASGEQVVIIDAVAFRLDGLRRAGFEVVQGDARDAATFEEAGVERDTLVLTTTTNDALNMLAAELVHAEFGVEHPVVVLQVPSEDFGTRTRAWAELFGGRAFDLSEWLRALEGGSVALVDVDLGSKNAVADVRTALKRWPGEAALVCAWNGDDARPHFGKLEELSESARLTLLLREGEASDYLQGHLVESAGPEARDGE